MEASSKASLAPATGRIWPKPRTTDGAAVPFLCPRSAACSATQKLVGWRKSGFIRASRMHCLMSGASPGAPLFLFIIYFIIL